MNYTTGQIAEFTEANLIGDSQIIIKNIEFDSRNIYSWTETAFIAIPTAKNSGEKYIQSAVEKGIQVIISEHQLPHVENITWIIVDDAVQFLQRFAKYHLSRFNLRTVGITGSNGKTIVKEWLYRSLFQSFVTVKSPKSFNSQLGLPLSLLQIKGQHEIGIFEVGISKPGEMKKLEDIFSPEIGILTHIGSAHSANFESEEQLINEKIVLFKDSKTIIFNGDNDAVLKLIDEHFSDRKLISYGFKERNDLSIKDGWLHSKEITVQYFGESLSIPVRQRDEATLSNALAVIAVLKELKFDNAAIVEKINLLKSVEMRLESVDGVRKNLLINDSYNLDLDSLIISYQFIKQYNKKKKTLILTDFLEGKDAGSLYQTVANLTNLQDFGTVFLIGDEITQSAHLFEAETFTFQTTEELIHSTLLNQIEDELILLKGARRFEIEKVKNHLELQKHDTVLEVNLNAILHNINVHKSLLKPETKMMAMVKAYSYGLGGYEIAEFLQHHHIDYLGVAYADEGVDLRKNGITTPVMVMNPEQHSYSSIIDYNLEPEIYSLRVLRLFNEQLIQKGIDRRYPIHLKVETGMHRLGFKQSEIPELLQTLQGMNVKVESIFSHLSSADDLLEKEFTFDQLTEFEAFSGKLILGLGYKPLRHILNSAGIATYCDYQYDMVRIGIGMVGISPVPEVSKHLLQAVAFKTVVSQISEVHVGDSVGYNRKHRPAKTTKIATVPVGYADGIPRLIGNSRGNVGIRGKLFPIVGNVCMDMMMVDIGDEPIAEGEEVVIFNENPSLSQFAIYCNTIPYEVLTSVSRRVKRIYIKK
ncbi:bifunctional UDP-N-acetylmuramoyl-tripeptide:D-alanyl-D-alanine ligase/alanine racemase [Kaistella palustris]|uniref:bifunctional UDP-N-acetylmuramoyl-tripeptide:D-alanyl-D-alanine ligase/alanine racemase n=1 Tax=Kaistella palustris TaxID=493376 RepID=UPI0004112701|nr:bifunctional UDP-N-acetylmuramoyl-tripeptide:D-alanyl-D-alanine ligase/alanine racemase [Kaistella palustris]